MSEVLGGSITDSSTLVILPIHFSVLSSSGNCNFYCFAVLYFFSTRNFDTFFLPFSLVFFPS